jgi:hypothetical protein
MKNCLLLVAGCLVGLAFAGRAEAQMWVTYYPTAAPVVYTSYYAPAPVVGYQPAAVVRTRYRPILGGTVTRVRPIYSPFVVNPVPVVYGY